MSHFSNRQQKHLKHKTNKICFIIITAGVPPVGVRAPGGRNVFHIHGDLILEVYGGQK